MPLEWPTPVVCPSWSLAFKPAGHTLSSINIFQTCPLYTDSDQIFHCVWTKGCSSAPPPLYTDSDQIFHCVWTKGCSSAPPPPSTLILIRSSTVSERRDALVPPPPSTLSLIRSSTVSERRDALVPPPPLHWFWSDLPLCLNEGML